MQAELLNQIGQVSLRISCLIYLFVLTPQVVLNLKKKTTQGYSYATHFILFTAYIADLNYAFGFNLQAEYIIVSCVGLLNLAIIHCLFYFDIKNSLKFKISSIFLCFFITCVFLLILNNIRVDNYIYGKYIFNFSGIVSNIGWFIYLIPQIIKNYKLKNTAGVSLLFVSLSLTAGICDNISAFCLNWPLPSKIGSPIMLISKIILISQIINNLKFNKKILKNLIIYIFYFI